MKIETAWERKEYLDNQRQKNASAFLQKCRSEGLSVYEVTKTLEKAQEIMEMCTDLDGGLILPD